VLHSTFGEGEVTHILGTGKKMNLAVKFSGLGQKIIDPRTAPMQLIHE
jgi:DNA helicase-2/ATP-dependent DNA helicase PcrA